VGLGKLTPTAKQKPDRNPSTAAKTAPQAKGAPTTHQPVRGVVRHDVCRRRLPVPVRLHRGRHVALVTEHVQLAAAQAEEALLGLWMGRGWGVAVMPAVLLVNQTRCFFSFSACLQLPSFNTAPAALHNRTPHTPTIHPSPKPKAPAHPPRRRRVVGVVGPHRLHQGQHPVVQPQEPLHVLGCRRQPQEVARLVEGVTDQELDALGLPAWWGGGGALGCCVVCWCVGVWRWVRGL